MRLTLRVLGADVFEVELAGHSSDQPALEATAGGQFDKAEEFGRPDTTVSGGWEPDDDRGPRVGFRRRRA